MTIKPEKVDFMGRAVEYVICQIDDEETDDPCPQTVPWELHDVDLKKRERIVC